MNSDPSTSAPTEGVARSRCSRTSIACGATFLVVTGVLLAMQLRIVTHVTGQDPFTYIRLGQDLLASGFAAEEITRVSGFIAPGFPVLLAALIFVAGPFAPAWLNTVLLILFFLILAHLLRQWQFPPWAPLIISLAAIGLILRGSTLAPHFLFYAFRGAIQFFFIGAAYAVMAGAQPTRKGGYLRLGLASTLVLLGALFRETTLMAGPAMCGWLWLNPVWRSARWRGTLWLAAPVLLTLAVAGVLTLVTGLEPNQQVIVWLQHLSGEAASQYGERVQQYLQFLLRAEWGPVGWVLGLAGIWHLRSRLHIVALWLVPAAAWILFYAGFLVHRRYLLDSLFFLAILSGVGTWHLLDLLLRRKFIHIDTWGVPVLIAGLLALNTHTIMHAANWGPRMSRSAVNDLLATVEAHTPSPGWILGDLNCRYLIDVLWVYGETRAPLRWEAWHSTTPPPTALLILADPARKGEREGVGTEDAVRARADVTPITDEAGEPVQIWMDERHYTLHAVTPWAATHALEPVHNADLCGGLIWLDFQQTDPYAERQAVLRSASGDALQTWSIGQGTGLIPLYVQASGWTHAMLEVTSSAPIPLRMVTPPVTAAPPCVFHLGPDRKPSALKWIGPPAHVGHPTHKWGSTLTTGATFTVPLPRGMASGRYRWVITLEPRFREAQEMAFYYYRGDERLASFTNRLDRGRFSHTIDFPAPFDRDAEHVELVVNVPDDWGNHFRLLEIGGEVIEPAPMPPAPCAL